MRDPVSLRPKRSRVAHRVRSYHSRRGIVAKAYVVIPGVGACWFQRAVR